MRVLVFGGGIGGLSAAHELVRRGFEVDVYERRHRWGGKARSVFKPGTGREGRHDLPGEHGQRVFSGFYRHLEDTLRSIPSADGIGSVYDHLVGTTETRFCREESPPIRVHTGRDGIDRLRALRNTVSLFADSGIRISEILEFYWRLLRLLCSSPERRHGVFENTAWTDLIRAHGKSAAYRAIFARGWSQFAAAAEGDVASARTFGEIFGQMTLFAKPGQPTVRVLNGPTSTVWIDPWVSHLRRLGVRFHSDRALVALKIDGQRILEAQVASREQETFTVRGDHYVCAVPVEVMQRIVTPALATAAPSLANLNHLTTRFMGGIQFFLGRDVPMTHGHFHYADSAWALASISQAQFWRQVDLRRYGNGDVRGVISVSIGDWLTPGSKTTSKRALDCTEDELCDEVWRQLLDHLPVKLREELSTAKRIDYCVDPAVCDVRTRADNLEPLMINSVGSWRYRPEAWTEISNLVLAADYVRTNTDLATMEAANEAARRAVNAILQSSGSHALPCAVWDLWVPRVVRLLQRIDSRLYGGVRPQPP